MDIYMKKIRDAPALGGIKGNAPDKPPARRIGRPFAGAEAFGGRPVARSAQRQPPQRKRTSIFRSR